LPTQPASRIAVRSRHNADSDQIVSLYSDLADATAVMLVPAVCDRPAYFRRSLGFGSAAGAAASRAGPNSRWAKSSGLWAWRRWPHELQHYEAELL